MEPQAGVEKRSPTVSSSAINPRPSFIRPPSPGAAGPGPRAILTEGKAGTFLTK